MLIMIKDLPKIIKNKIKMRIIIFKNLEDISKTD